MEAKRNSSHKSYAVIGKTSGTGYMIARKSCHINSSNETHRASPLVPCREMTEEDVKSTNLPKLQKRNSSSEDDWISRESGTRHMFLNHNAWDFPLRGSARTAEATLSKKGAPNLTAPDGRKSRCTISGTQHDSDPGTIDSLVRTCLKL